MAPNATSVISAAGRNAVVTSLMVCCGFIVCLSPYHIQLIVDLFGNHTVDYSSWYYRFNATLLFTNSIINPFIYTAKYGEFQQGVRRLLSKLKLNKQHSQVAAVA